MRLKSIDELLKECRALSNYGVNIEVDRHKISNSSVSEYLSTWYSFMEKDSDIVYLANREDSLILITAWIVPLTPIRVIHYDLQKGLGEMLTLLYKEKECT